MMHETFWTLLRDPAHWEFETFLTTVQEGLLLGLLWPFIHKHWKHHIARDKAESAVISLPEPIHRIETPQGICPDCSGPLEGELNTVQHCPKCQLFYFTAKITDDSA